MPTATLEADGDEPTATLILAGPATVAERSGMVDLLGHFARNGHRSRQQTDLGACAGGEKQVPFAAGKRKRGRGNGREGQRENSGGSGGGDGGKRGQEVSVIVIPDLGSDRGTAQAVCGAGAVFDADLQGKIDALLNG